MLETSNSTGAVLNVYTKILITAYFKYHFNNPNAASTVLVF